MPFQKGNKLGAKGAIARQENRKKVDGFLQEMASGALRVYQERLKDLSQGTDLEKPVKEFMDRFEGWREFIVPKLTRSEITGKDGKELFATKIYDQIPSE